ncbi:ubiquitin-conjugating enzyme/RWD-like protein [Gilbertella persicaria]|uniref:ubiquitin-conjugating enzyme/RWD-like protein n=1 Tax=Gilbertella persicaria TaxID=101096 RepID=UPI00221FC48E|nr:ubiquitin-conjugating enzyme/RWD-like protein [Gilbertella persicaria]KAI8098419.1 ubiquitin-conjugating enzyme/RWD-like protein [Gilbertella persicaria]
MATKGAYKRLTKEYLAIQKNPPPYIIARPLESNILDWHYVITGPPDSPYEGGEYYGRITFPAEYPFKPPAIRMTTPSGRFQPDTRLCLSMSDFHPSSWNPSWSIATILNGLLSFMVGDEATTGSIKTGVHEKKMYAARSHLWNIRNPKFREVFPELCTINLNQMPTDQLLIKRNIQNSSPAHTVAHTDNHAITRTAVSRGKRWIVVLVVFVYLILSKLIARSTNAGSA